MDTFEQFLTRDAAYQAMKQFRVFTLKDGRRVLKVDGESLTGKFAWLYCREL